MESVELLYRAKSCSAINQSLYLTVGDWLLSNHKEELHKGWCHRAWVRLKKSLILCLPLQKKILKMSFFIHCQFSSPSIDSGSIRNKVMDEKVPAIKELKVYRGRSTLEGVMRITQWLKSGTKCWLYREDDFKPSCDCVCQAKRLAPFFHSYVVTHSVYSNKHPQYDYFFDGNNKVFCQYEQRK